jgi:hypothetical protein
MNYDKKCSTCKRIYRGEGFRGNCNADCWYKAEYARRHPEAKIRQVKGYDIRYPVDPMEIQKQQKEKNDAINSKWTKEKKKLSVKEQQRINNLLNNKHLRKTMEFDDRKFKSVRG